MSTTDNRLRRAYEYWVRDEIPQSWAFATAVLNDEPDNPKALVMAGCIMRSNGDVGAASQLLRRAVSLAPKVPNAWMHYGACLQDLHRYEEAREAFLLVHKALPHDPMSCANIAATYVQQGRARETVEWSDKALTLIEDCKEPDLAERATRIAQISRAFGCLALGRWVEGWKSAEYLYGDHLKVRIYRPEGEEWEPLWDGSPGKTVVVQADQGMGDMIMFSQCLKPMIRDCKKVIIETSSRMVHLFRRNFPEADVYGTLKQRANVTWPLKYQIDARTHLSFLGKFYRKSNADFPKEAYLKPRPDRALVWRALLENYPRPWVGIAWRGGIQRTNEASRSMRLEDLAPIINGGGTMFNLAYQEVGLELARWNIDHSVQIMNPNLSEDDYEDTVALVSELDEVVTVQTTIAHVCGALGKKASVLVNQQPQWRYCYGGDHLMWYPDTLTIYRQKPGEVGWSHVIARLAKERQQLIAA